MNDKLLALVKEYEIKVVVFTVGSFKASGPDGHILEWNGNCSRNLYRLMVSNRSGLTKLWILYPLFFFYKYQISGLLSNNLTTRREAHTR